MKTGRVVLKWLDGLCFLGAAYLLTFTLFREYALKTYETQYLFSLNVPLLGKSWISAPIWFCAVVALVTIVLAILCVGIRYRIDSLPFPEKNSTEVQLSNLKISVEVVDGNRYKRIVLIFSFALFLISVLLVAVPALTALLVERTPFLGELFFGLTENRIRNTFLSAGYEPFPSMEIALRITQAVIHQCVLFLSAYWFFCNLGWKQPIPKASETAVP